MYKPIIQNFIFFKNFQNTDFIVKVILAFKPIIAYKNDILVNENDLVEDIMFVKKGILSIELPINLLNPHENIDKFLKKPNLTMDKGTNFEKFENSSTIQGSQYNSTNILFNSTIQEKDLKIKAPLKNYNSLFTMGYSFNTNFTQIEKERKAREELEKRKNFIYVKILGIRENEHFGDVLMFLEQRSPFRVRVKSFKCELFFLKKIDAITISTNYQNIWKSNNNELIENTNKLNYINKDDYFNDFIDKEKKK